MRTYLVGMILFLMSGCATLTGERSKQSIYVDSNPQNAEVYLNSEFLGKTPSLLLVPRAKEQELVFKKNGEVKKLQLSSNYRWYDSFIGNLLFFGFAPFGWATDLVSKAAWELEEPRKIEFRSRINSGPQPLARKTIVIAPPYASSLTFSMEAGKFWERKLRETYPNEKIMSFEKSLKEFIDAGFDFDRKITDDDTKKIPLVKLKADEVFYSEVIENEMELELKGARENYKGEKSGELVGQIARVTSGSSSQINKLKFKYGLRELIPNTVSLDFSNSRNSLTDNRGLEEIRHESRTIRRNSVLGTMSQSFESLSLSRVQIPRLDTGWRGRYFWTPGGKISYQRFEFPEFDLFEDVQFEHFRIGAGIGLEGNLSYKKLVLFLKVIPLLSFYQLNWQGADHIHKSVSNFSIDIQAELGAMYFLNPKFHLRLFSRSISNNTETWRHALEDIAPGVQKISTPSEIISGVGLGYLFQ